MANIDDRVVSATFDATRFVSGVSTTLSSLDKLNAALKKAGHDNGLDQIEKSSNKISFGGLSSAIDKIKSKLGFGREAQQGLGEIDKAAGKVTFSPLQRAIESIKGKFNFGREADQAFAQVERASGRVTFSGLSQAISNVAGQFSILDGAAAVALGNIITRATTAGAALAKSLTFEPVTTGFHEYETQIKSVQTILSNTAAAGTDLKDVNAALAELNKYADQTIYNFSEMTKNIGTFTAAGVDLETATGSIKGIANLAALSGSSSQQAATAMYQLSQAISAGRVSLQDWNSVVNAGMGGSVFQRALAQTAVAMGEIDESALKLTGKMKNVTINGQSFRESIMAKPGEQSWLTGEVLTNTLQQLSGDLSEAELKAQGFSDAQIKAIQQQAKMAVNAATQVKTLSALLDTTKEQVASGWAQTWQIVFGDFEGAKKLFSGLSAAIGDFVGKNADARNKVLKDWAALGGRQALFDGLKASLEALKSVLGPIKDAFRDIFPAKTGQDLKNMSVAFRDFMQGLKLGPETMENLRRTFRGLFAVLDIGKQLIGGVVTALGRIFGAAGKGSGGILALTGSLGDLIVRLNEWLRRGDKIKTVFAGIGDALAAPIRLIGELTSKLGGLFGATDTGGASSALSGLGQALDPAARAADAASSAWEGFLDVLRQVGDVLRPVATAIAEAFGSIGDAIADALASNDWSNVFTVIQTGLVAGIFLTIKKALGGGLNIDFGGGVLESLSESLNVLRNSLVAIQRNIQARTLLLIASAVAVLAAAVVALSLVKADKLGQAMSAITIAMGQLMAAMAILGKVGGHAGIIAAPVIAGALVLLASSLLVLSGAVHSLARLSWEELAKGLSGIAVMLGTLAAAVGPLSRAGPGILITSTALIALGVAMNILAGAVKIFSTMSWEELAKGLSAVAVALIAIGTAMRLMPLTLAVTGAGLVIVGVGLTAVAGAVALFGNMDLSTLAKGIGATAAALVAIGLAMGLMPLTLPVTAAGLVLVGVGLNAVGAAIGLMGNMKFSTLAKGIGAIAASLIVLAGGLTAMIVALPGAAALLVAAGALAVLVPVIGMLGNMDWGTIAKGLAAIALTLGTLAVSSLVAAPALAALGLALVPFGAGLAAVGAAVYLMSKGLSLLATDGTKGLAVFMASITALIAIIPKVIISFVKGLVQIVAEIAKLAPQVVDSMVKIVNSLVEVIIRTAPRVALAVTALITAFLQVLAQNAGPIISAGAKLLMQLLRGIANNIADVTRTVATIVTRFISALASRAGQLVSAGATLLVRFVQGVTNNIGRIVAAVASLIARFLSAVANNIGKVVTAGGNIVVKLIQGITNQAGRIVTAGANAIIKFATGVTNNIGRVVSAGVTLVARLINTVGREAVRMADEGAKAVVRFVNGVAEAIRANSGPLGAAGANLGTAIVEGMIRGLGSMAGALMSKVSSLISSIPGKAKKLLGIGSPSKVFSEIGGFVVQGLANGIGSSSGASAQAAANMARGVIGAVSEALQIQSPSKVMVQLGKWVGDGFAQGLKGSQETINAAFVELQGKLGQAVSTLRQTIDTEQDRLDRLRDAKKPDRKAIAEARKDIQQNNALLKIAKDAHTNLVKGLKEERAELSALAKDFEQLGEQLQGAEQALADAKRMRDEAVSSFTDQYSELPDIVKEDAEGNPVDQLATYQQALQNQINAVSAYKATLDQLRALGLDDKTYQKLLEEGTANQQFADQLLAGGRTAIEGLNHLDRQLMSVSAGLATNAARNLYQAGVDAAQGLVDGLNSKRSEIRKAMERIAEAMIRAIKKKLKIKSPSQEFAEIGRFSSIGMAEGLQASSKVVTDAASQIADDAVLALRDGMAQVHDILNAEIDSNPTVTPVLDLAQFQKDAAAMSKMTNVVPISAAASYGLASLVDIPKPGSEDGSLEDKIAMLKFEQNNYSPKALSEAEIYRQTNNQLSQAKKALGL